MKNFKIYYTFVVVFVLNTTVYASDDSPPDIVTKVATCAANWLKLETGTRAIGMGGAYTAAARGISGTPYNPASIAFINNQQAFLSQTKYVADITYSVLGYGRNMSGTDFIGLHIFALDSGPMDITTLDDPEGTGEQFKVTGVCIRGTYARRLTDRLRIGFTGKFIREDIHTAYMQTVAFDVGSNFDTGIFGFILGMSVTNLGPEAQFGGEGLEIDVPDDWDQNGDLAKVTEKFPLPMTFRMGFMNEIVGPKSDFLKSENHKLIMSVDGINARDYVLYGTLGLEYGWKDIAYVRLGNRLGHDTAKWSVGGGFNIKSGSVGVALDYAYVNYSLLNFTHQFGLNFEF